MLLPTASANDVAFMQQHTTAVTKRMMPRLVQSKQVHASAGPVCTVAPAVTGTVTVGQVQTCAPGTWLNSPTFTYQWRRRKEPISGATAATYTLASADSSYEVYCDVTATNGAGVATTSSNKIAVP